MKVASPSFRKAIRRRRNTPKEPPRHLWRMRVRTLCFFGTEPCRPIYQKRDCPSSQKHLVRVKHPPLYVASNFSKRSARRRRIRRKAFEMKRSLYYYTIFFKICQVGFFRFRRYRSQKAQKFRKARAILAFFRFTDARGSRARDHRAILRFSVVRGCADSRFPICGYTSTYKERDRRPLITQRNTANAPTIATADRSSLKKTPRTRRLSRRRPRRR